MRIALIGYGKMGKAIEEIAQQRGHEIAMRIGSSNYNTFKENNLADVDVAIEFTTPELAYDNVVHCLKHDTAVVCGTTGWNNKLSKAKEQCVVHNGTFLHASNFSIGVNLFFEVNRQLAALMNDWEGYDVSIKEVHHVEKKDAPSGTAITIAEQILDNVERKKRWTLTPDAPDDNLFIDAQRSPNVPGTHYVKYTSDIDEIELVHTAHSRKGFAFGAVLAAEFAAKRKGILTMRDVLNGATHQY